MSDPVNPPTFVATSPLTARAFALARERHEGQRRKADGADFLLHPLEVAAILDTTGAADHVVAAGLLHDVLEKSDTEPWEVEAGCGAAVRELVEAVSENPACADRGERKAELRRRVGVAGAEAALLFAADKVSKLREWRIRIACGDRPPPQTILHYRERLAAVEASLADTTVGDLLRFELEALGDFPPAPAARSREVAPASTDA